MVVLSSIKKRKEGELVLHRFTLRIYFSLEFNFHSCCLLLDVSDISVSCTSSPYNAKFGFKRLWLFACLSNNPSILVYRYNTELLQRILRSWSGWNRIGFKANIATLSQNTVCYRYHCGSNLYYSSLLSIKSNQFCPTHTLASGLG